MSDHVRNRRASTGPTKALEESSPSMRSPGKVNNACTTSDLRSARAHVMEQPPLHSSVDDHSHNVPWSEPRLLGAGRERRHDTADLGDVATKRDFSLSCMINTTGSVIAGVLPEPQQRYAVQYHWMSEQHRWYVPMRWSRNVSSGYCTSAGGKRQSIPLDDATRYHNYGQVCNAPLRNCTIVLIHAGKTWCY